MLDNLEYCLCTPKNKLYSDRSILMTQFQKMANFFWVHEWMSSMPEVYYIIFDPKPFDHLLDLFFDQLVSSIHDTWI